MGLLGKAGLGGGSFLNVLRSHLITKVSDDLLMHLKHPPIEVDHGIYPPFLHTKKETIGTE